MQTNVSRLHECCKPHELNADAASCRYSLDEKACEWAGKVAASPGYESLHFLGKQFVAMPFMHTETVEGQQVWPGSPPTPPICALQQVCRATQVLSCLHAHDIALQCLGASHAVSHQHLCKCNATPHGSLCPSFEVTMMLRHAAEVLGHDEGHSSCPGDRIRQ
jgi:hypothetical protein